MDQPKIGIIGSCVTRDVWNVLGLPPANIRFHARTSIPSVVSLPLNSVQIPENFEAAGAKFEDRNLRADILKTTLSDIEKFSPHALFFDLIDERFDLLKLDKTIISDSPILDDSGLKSFEPFSSGRVIGRLSPEAFALWQRGAIALTKRIINGPLANAQIFIHRCLWATHTAYLDGRCVAFPREVDISPRQRANIVAHNDLLVSYYNTLEKCFPFAVVLSPPAELRLADPNHIWGHSPFHFIRPYYEWLWTVINEHQPFAAVS